MAADERIESYINTEATKKETDTLIGYLNQLVVKFDEVNAKTVSLGNSTGFGEYKKKVKETTEAANEYAKTTKMVVDQAGKLVETVKTQTVSIDALRKVVLVSGQSFDTNNKVLAQYSVQLGLVQNEIKKLKANTSDAEKQSSSYQARLGDLMGIEKEVKNAAADLSLTVKNQVKEFQASEGSIDALQAKYNQLQQTYEQLSNEERSSPFGADLKKTIDELLPELNALEQGTGKFGRNVGNYAGSLAKPFEMLKAELQKVQQQIALTGKQDPGFDRLQNEAVLLEKIIEGVDKTFGSTKQEMRAFQEAAKQLGLEFGNTNELFQSFVQEVGSQKDKLDDIQATINFNASDTKYLDGVVSGINGVVGAYGAWQSITVLVGKDQEELAKSMQKLQAILTLVQSLQAVLNAVQTESGAIQTALAAKTALVNAAKKVEALLFAQTTAAVAANTVATEANAGAQVLLAEGEAAASAGAIGLRTAIISTGIGALVLALVYGITKLVGAITDWVGADERAVKIQTELVKAMNDVADAQIELTKQVQDGVQLRIAAMEREAEVIKASGVTSARSMAIDKQVAETKLATANAIVYSNNITEESRARADKALQESLKNVELYEGIKASIIRAAAAKNKTADEDDIKRIDQQIELAKSQTTGFQKEYDKQNDALKNKYDFQKNLDVIKAADDKRKADDARKVALETVRVESDLVQTKNNVILNSDKSTYQQRLAALRSNLSEQKKIAQAELDNIDPTASDADKQIARKKFYETSKKLSIEEKEAEKKINEDYDKRLLDANFNLNKALLDIKIQASEKIISNELETLDKRMNAVKSFTENQKKLADEDYNYQKDNLIKTIPDVAVRNKQIELLDADHNAKLVQIVADSEQKKLEVIKSAIAQKQFLNDKFNEFILQTTQGDVDRTQQYSKDVQALNTALQKKKTSIEKYNADLKILEDKLLIDSITAELNKQKRLVEIGNLSPEAKKAALIKIAELEKDLSNANTQLQIDNEDKKRAAFFKTLDQAKEVTDAIASAFQAVVNGNLDAQKNAVQEQLDAIDKQKEAEIAAAEASTLSAADKANKIATINAVAQSKKEALERRQRELDNQKAKADRAFQIFNIVGNTAVAVTKFLSTGNLPAAIIAGIIGAAQLVSVLAQPIPKYAKGRAGGPAEFAIVGEAGPEKIIYPDGTEAMSPDAPTLTFLPQGSKVLTHEQTMMDMLGAASLRSMAEKSGAAVNERDFDNSYLHAVSTKLDNVSSGLKGVKSAIENKPVAQLDVTWSGISYMQQSAAGWTEWVNKYFKT